MCVCVCVCVRVSGLRSRYQSQITHMSRLKRSASSRFFLNYRGLTAGGREPPISGDGHAATYLLVYAACMLEDKHLTKPRWYFSPGNRHLTGLYPYWMTLTKQRNTNFENNQWFSSVVLWRENTRTATDPCSVLEVSLEAHDATSGKILG